MTDTTASHSPADRSDVLIVHRYLLGLAPAVYLLWWCIVHWLLPASFNPLGSRLAVCGLFFALLLLSFVSRGAIRQVAALYFAAVVVLTAHYFYLFAYNPGDLNWVIGSYITVLAAGSTILDSRRLFAYTVFVLITDYIVVMRTHDDMVALPGMATVLALMNITGFLRRKAETERQLRLEAQAQRQTAESVNRAKMLFLANVNHELRTPLTGIIGFNDLMTALPSDAAERQHYSKRIDANARALLDIVEQILILTESDVAQMQVATRRVDVRHLLRERLEAQRQPCAEKGLELDLRFDEGLPQFLVLDPGRVGRVVANILGNAVKFTAHGRINVEARLRREPENGQSHGRSLLEISVADTGAGLPRDQWERIFESFTQVHAGFDRPYGGAGLGLAVARQIARTLAGDVQVSTSAVGQGTTFKATVQVKE
jgi:signal transduction histidine kinase